MKNLFKNLMLVAVAAMAFTACSQDVNEVNNIERVTRYEFTANIADENDDTRSGFVGKNEAGNAYVSEWEGNETLKLFITDYNGYYVETTAPINAEGNFALELTDAPESFFMSVCSPAESWVSEYTANIPTEQTPLANSVDPKAHVLSAVALPISGNSASITMSPQGACYGKMTVNAPDFEIAKVEVSFNGGQVYTINATNVENNVFWFAVDSMIDVATFTVTAYDAENNALTKTVDVAAAGKTLKFQWGRVSTFSVSGLEAYVEPAVPAFTSAELTGDWFQDNQFTFVDESGELLDLAIDLASEDAYNNNDTLILEGEYTIEDCYLEGYTKYGDTELGAVNIKVTHIQGGYHIEFSNIKDTNGNLLLDRAIFEGPIIDYGNPDLRTPLATPSNVKLSVSGKDITVTWDKVDNAVKYSVECYDEETKVVTDTTVTFSLPNYEETYSFRITALAGESDKYRDSETTGWYNTETEADPRAVLSVPTNIKATIDGRYATIEWDAVEGADYYQLSYNLNGNQTVDVTETSYTIDVGFGVSNLMVYVFAKANEDNPDYKSSESGSVVVNTGKDPDKFADLEATSISWSSSGYFTLKVPGFSYFYLAVPNDNHPGNNSLNVGDYTFGTNVNQFRIRYNNGSLYNWSDHDSNLTTMSVNFVDNQYVILINVHSLYSGYSGSIGYKGMPDGWVAPANLGDSGEGGDGGDEPVDPEQPEQPEQPSNELGSESNPYTFTSVAVNGFFMYFQGAENGASLQLDRQKSDVNYMSNYGGPFALDNGTIIYSGSGNVYNVGGNTYYYASFAPYSTLEVTKANGNWTCKLKMSVDAGATYTYYTYTGQITNQPY